MRSSTPLPARLVMPCSGVTVPMEVIPALPPPSARIRLDY
jgi:hypothetical protein